MLISDIRNIAYIEQSNVAHLFWFLVSFSASAKLLFPRFLSRLFHFLLSFFILAFLKQKGKQQKNVPFISPRFKLIYRLQFKFSVTSCLVVWSFVENLWVTEFRMVESWKSVKWITAHNLCRNVYRYKYISDW